MKLSTRLATIADMIRNGETVADIGTDHGQLPVFLCGEKRCPKVIMTDVSEGSLAKARLTGQGYLQAQAASGGTDMPLLEARLGDGLAPLLDGEADVVVMAGIGGGLMERILRADPAKSASMGRYILQPRRSPGELRRFLASAGYRILEEKLIPESRFIWEIIVCAPEGSRFITDNNYLVNTSPNSAFAEQVPGADTTIFWEIPSYYGSLDDSLMDEYLRRKLAREKRNQAGRMKAEAPEEEGLAEGRRNIAYIEGLIEARKRRMDTEEDSHEV